VAGWFVMQGGGEMGVRKVPAGLAVGLLLAACSNSGDSQTATATTTPTVPVETTAATTTTATTKPPTGLGVTQRYESSDGMFAGRITVFRYRASSVVPDYLEAELRKESKRSVAVELRVCVTKAVDDDNAADLGWSVWSLGDDSGGSYEAWISWHDSVTVQPLYPDGKATPAGICRRGWVPFELPRNARPSQVEYNTGEGGILTWPIKT
jgi:hypothetical protein